MKLLILAALHHVEDPVDEVLNEDRTHDGLRVGDWEIVDQI